MTSLLFGITTSPRPASYLLQTIRSIKAAGQAIKPRFIISPNFIDHDEDWTAIQAEIGPEGTLLGPLIPEALRDHVEGRPDLHDFTLGNCIYSSESTHRGIQTNSDRLLKAMIDTGEEFFVSCQDDLVMCPRAVDRIWNVATWIMPRGARKTGAITFYSPQKQCGSAQKCLWRYPPNSFYGELAVLWRASCAQEFLGFSNHNEAHDLEIGRFFATYDRKWGFWGHSPCLVQHVGDASARGAVTQGMVRSSMNFRADHDAIKQAKGWP